MCKKFIGSLFGTPDKPVTPAVIQGQSQARPGGAAVKTENANNAPVSIKKKVAGQATVPGLGL